MEYIEGPNLEQYIRLRDKLDIPGNVRLIIDIGKGLSAAHELGIIHRDVKPQNILLQDGKVPKILDFGIARGAEGSDMTTDGLVMGSPKYMSRRENGFGI